MLFILILSGISKAPLGFAKWGDVEGLKTLVSHMNDVPALSVQLALFKPDQAKILRASDILTKLIKEGNLPTMLTTEVKKSFGRSGLSQGKKGRIIKLEVPVNGIEFTVAIGIMPDAAYGRNDWGRDQQSHIDRLPEWIQVQAKNQVMMDSPRRDRPIWITRLTQEKWDEIEPGLSINCSIGKRCSWF